MNYAFTLLLKDKDEALRDRIEAKLRAEKVEFRRGMSGGGNQLRQPYLTEFFKIKEDPKKFPVVEWVHFFGCYIGNYPGLEKQKIKALCDLVNNV